MKTNVVAIVLLAMAAVGSATVVSLTPETFDTVVGGPKGVLVKFFAPWCGHCKHLAPEYEKASESFGDGAKVMLAEVDCDAHADLCQRFQVQGYPTVKFFPKGENVPEDYEGGRTADDIVQFLEGKGARRSGHKSAVASLDPETFPKVALDPHKDVLVKFFAPWCGHCKHLAPVYETVASAYAAEEELVVAEVNCDAHKDLCGQYGVQGFPTLKFFPKGDKSGQDYTGGREVNDFVEYLNSNLHLHRTASGRLDEKAGRVAALDPIAAKFSVAEDKAAVLAEAQGVSATLVGDEAKAAKTYLKVMELAIEKGDCSAYVASEKARVQRFIDGGKVSAKKIDEFSKRINILSAF